MPKLTVSIDGVVIKQIELGKERTTLGRRPYNDIVIDNLAVSGEHAVFLLQGPQAYIEDLNSTNGTYVNGRAIQSEPLRHEDLIEIGRYKIKFLQPEGDVVAPPPPAPADHAPNKVDGFTPPPPARIKVLNGASAGREAPLVKVVTTIGKPGVAIASVTQHANGYTLSLVEGVTTPTINGRPLGHEPQPLKHGDTIELAGTQMQFLQD